jgi:hypothetical protein
MGRIVAPPAAKPTYARPHLTPSSRNKEHTQQRQDRARSETQGSSSIALPRELLRRGTDTPPEAGLTRSADQTGYVSLHPLCRFAALVRIAPKINLMPIIDLDLTARGAGSPNQEVCPLPYPLKPDFGFSCRGRAARHLTGVVLAILNLQAAARKRGNPDNRERPGIDRMEHASALVPQGSLPSGPVHSCAQGFLLGVCKKSQSAEK